MRQLTSLLLGGALAFILASCGSPNAGSAPAAGPAPTFTPPAKPSTVHIPALGVTSNIIDLGLQPDGKMEVPGATKEPSDAVKDAGWFTSSPLPGQPGPSVLAAHVDWKGEDGPFAKLDQLKQGDEVTVESTDGAQVTFVVDRVETHPKAQFPTEAVYSDTEGPELRLVTCGGVFDTASGHYQDNTIAFAKLA